MRFDSQTTCFRTRGGNNSGYGEAAGQRSVSVRRVTAQIIYKKIPDTLVLVIEEREVEAKGALWPEREIAHCDS